MEVEEGRRLLTNTKLLSVLSQKYSLTGTGLTFRFRNQPQRTLTLENRTSVSSSLPLYSPFPRSVRFQLALASVAGSRGVAGFLPPPSDPRPRERPTPTRSDRRQCCPLLPPPPPPAPYTVQ